MTDGSWNIRHRAVTGSTNQDALDGEPGDVFTADVQTAGRGRLNHRWLSQPGENLTMSAVIGVDGLPPEEVATLPLVVGFAAADMVKGALLDMGEAERAGGVRLKWPNDVLVRGRKICGILCERSGGRVIAGIGLNANQVQFPAELEGRATSLAAETGSDRIDLTNLRDNLLRRLGDSLAAWRQRGFAAIWPKVAQIDFLKGLAVSVERMDGDPEPVSGECGGIQPDGSLLVGGERIFAGEAHVAFRSRP